MERGVMIEQYKSGKVFVRIYSNQGRLVAKFHALNMFVALQILGQMFGQRDAIKEAS